MRRRILDTVTIITPREYCEPGMAYADMLYNGNPPSTYTGATIVIKSETNTLDCTNGNGIHETWYHNPSMYLIHSIQETFGEDTYNSGSDVSSIRAGQMKPHGYESEICLATNKLLIYIPVWVYSKDGSTSGNKSTKIIAYWIYDLPKGFKDAMLNGCDMGVWGGVVTTISGYDYQDSYINDYENSSNKDGRTTWESVTITTEGVPDIGLKTNTITIKQEGSWYKDTDGQVKCKLSATLGDEEARTYINWRTYSGVYDKYVTIDQDGVMTALSPGTAFITCELLNNGYYRPISTYKSFSIPDPTTFE